MSIRNLQYFAQTVPDLAVAEKFFKDFGLEVFKRDGVLVCRCFERDQDQILLYEGNKKSLHHISFGTTSDELIEIEARLQQAGVEFEVAPAGTLANGLWFRDFEGMLTNVQVADEAPYHVGLEVELNGPAARPRQGTRSVMLDKPDIRPRRLGHLVLFSTDCRKKLEFYRSAFDLEVSDSAAGLIYFMRSPAGSDHHIIAAAQSKNCSVQHAAFEVGSLDEIGWGAHRLIEKGYVPCWGPGRHTAGSNHFFYVRDPWMGLVEYFFDIDYIPANSDWQPMDYDTMEEASLWGPLEPPDFATNFEVLSGPRMN